MTAHCASGPDLSDLSHSYPFLGLARTFRVPYADVLRAAASIDRGHPQTIHLPHRVAHAVYAVCNAPWRWQFPPQGRGL